MIEAVIAGVFGLLIGSFLNVCVYRMPRDLSVVRPRSFCPGCEQTIAWYDNIPVVSFVWLRGGCRNCGARIPWRYPAVEVLTGLIFFCAVLTAGPTWPAVKLCVFGAIQVVLIFTDLEERILPDEFTRGGAVLGVVLAALIPNQGSLWGFILGPGWPVWLVSMIDAAFAALVSGLLLWGVGVLYKAVRHKEGLGLGDVKMIAMIGAFLGLQGVLMTLIVGSTAGAIGGLLFIVFARKDAASYELPFGSFLGAAAIVVAFYAQSIGAWYGRLGQ